MSFHTISKFSAICPECGNTMPIKGEHVFKADTRFRFGYLMSHLLPSGPCGGNLYPTLRHVKTGRVLFLHYNFSIRTKQFNRFKRDLEKAVPA